MKASSMKEYLANIVAESEALAKKVQAKSQEEQSDCEGCDEFDQCEMDERMSSMLNGIIDADDVEDTISSLASVVMLLAKRTGMEQTSRAAFEVWLTV